MARTKPDSVDAVRSRLILPRNQSTDIITPLLEIMKKSPASGENVLISGLGKFCADEKREGRGRNPDEWKMHVAVESLAKVFKDI